MDVTLPDGTTVKGVPDGTTKAQLAEKLKANGRDVPKEWLSPTPDAIKAPSVAPKEAYGLSPLGGGIVNNLTGMIAKPISDVAGLAAVGKEMISPTPDGGDPEGFKRHVQEALTYQPRTPAGRAVAEYNPVALVGKGIGKVAEGTGNLIKGEAPGAIRQGIGNAVQEGINQAPGILGAKYGPSVSPKVSAAIRGESESLMQSALKPTLSSLKKGDAAAAIDLMLDQNIPLSKKGVQVLRDKIDVLNDQISDAVKNSKGTVKLSDVAHPVKEKLDSFKNQVNPDADMAAIKQSWEEFKNHPALKGSDEIPVPLAQELKQGTYRQLSKKYGEMGNASVEAQKAIARGLKEGVAANAPEVVEFNKQESRILRTLPLIERRVLMDANKNPAGLSLLAKNPAAWGAFMLDRSAGFKSLAARLLNSNKDRIGSAAGASVAAPAVGSYIRQLTPQQDDQ